MSWTDERVELLKKLWSDGLSASQIAAELGGITRNAVIGKVHRLGLSGRAKAASSAAPRQRKARSSTHMLRIGRGAIRGNTALAHAYEIEPEVTPRAGREHHPDRPAPHYSGIDRANLPLADRRSRQHRILFLRRQYDRGSALLRIPLARCVSTGGRSSPRPAFARALATASLSQHGVPQRSRSGRNRRDQPTRAPSF